MKIRTKILLFLIIVFSLQATDVTSQVTQEWVQRYHGPMNGSDAGNSITVDKAGNVYLTGSTTNVLGTDIITIKYNSSGLMLWLNIYNGPGNNVDRGAAIKVDNAGNAYVTGVSRGSSTRFDYVTIKYDSSGVLKWVQRFDGPTSMDDFPSDLAIDNSGNVYVTGWCSAGTSFDDYATVKYNSEGVLQWIQRYNGNGNNEDIARSIGVDVSGNLYVSGSSAGTNTGYDYATIKYNSAGDSLWVRRYNGPLNGEDNVSSLATDNSGNVYITGRSAGSNGIDTTFDIATIKYNTAGEFQWVQRYNGPANGHEEASGIAVDNLGYVLVTGSGKGLVAESDYITIKYSSSAGTQQWVQRYYGIGYGGVNGAKSITTDRYGNIYVTGESSGESPVNQYDYATIKYNPAGVTQWIKRYNGPANGIDWAHSLVVDSAGNVYVTGESMGMDSGMDIATVKYSQTIGIQIISTEIPVQYILTQNYPNP
ncbi:MAG: PKD repeat protein, partial [Chlorobi bacterium OLB5]